MKHIKNDLLYRLLLQASDDWLSYAEIRGLIAESYATQVAEHRNVVFLSIIRELLVMGVLVAGDVFEDKGFIPWDCSTEKQAQRIEDTSAGRDEFAPGDICWFNLTPLGVQKFISLQAG